MATLKNVIDVIPSATLKTKGTGNKGNISEFTNTKSIWFTEDGFTYDPTADFGEVYLKSLIASKKLIVLNDVVNFIAEAQDDEVETFEDGTEKTQRQGLYKFTAEFTKGLHFNSALSSLASFKSLNATLVDREGNVILTKDASGKPKGFSLGMVQNKPLKMASTTTSQREGIVIQLLKRTELDDDYSFISSRTLDFDATALPQVVDTVVNFTAIPASAGTSIEFTVAIEENGDALSGLTSADTAVYVAGAKVSAPDVTESLTIPGKYTATTSALVSDAEVKVVLENSTTGDKIIELAGFLFQSNEGKAIVV